MKLNKFPSILLFALFAFIMTACEKTHWDEYDKSNEDVCAFLYETGSFKIPNDEITLTLTRLSSKGSLTAEIATKGFTVDSDLLEDDEEVSIEDWFNCPTTVTFAEGSTTAEITITVKENDRHESGNEYTWTIFVAGEHAAPGDYGCSVTVTHK